MREYAEAEPELRYPMFHTCREATWDMLPFLFKNPGVGMNAGAAPPGEDKTNAANFVVEEVLADKDRITISAH